MNEQASKYARTEFTIREETRPELSYTPPDRDHRKRRNQGYISGSLWSHLAFGLGTLAVIVIPPLIPGVTGRGLIMGVIGALVTCYTVVYVWSIARDLRSSRTQTRIRHSK